MINGALDRLLSLFTHFVFIFIDIYFHLRITIRESIVSKPLINKTKFKKYFVILDEAKHFVFELGDEKAVPNKTLVMIGGIPTHPMESMTWFADCLNQIDPSLRIIIFNMPYYDQHHSIECSNYFAQSNGESLRTHKEINYSNRKIDPKFSHKNQSKTINSLMDKMKLDQAHLVGHDRGAVILENLCINNPEKVISYSRASQVWDYAETDWSKLAPEILVGPPHKLMSIYFQLRLLLFSVLIMNRPMQLLSENFLNKAKHAQKGTHLFDRYTHLKFKSQISYKKYYYKFQQSLMQGGMFDEVINRKHLKKTNFPIMQFQGEDEFKLATNGCRISDQPYFGKYNLFRNEIEDIYPDGTYQSEVPIKNEFITSKGLYKEIKIKDGARFSKFYLIPDSAHFNVIENPESCAAAVYNFVTLANNNHKGDNNVR
jgi:pimeloyl-ACP methyl ester carboxylesterase